jgi:glucokinase
MADLFIGIDFGGTNVKLGLVDGDGKVLLCDEAPSRIEEGPDAMIKRIGDACEQMLSKQQLNLGQVRAAGIGTPGPIDLEAGKIVTACNLPASFDDYPVRDNLTKRLGCPVAFDNDANVACWGEFWLGAGSDINDMILFTLGTGIGGGVISSGELVHGCTGNAAELGHIIVHPGGRLCTCGQKGCLETYASATHIAARANEAMGAGRDSAGRVV